MSLAGRVAIVTGATKGIGLAIARRLGVDGAAVVVSSRKEANVSAAVASLKADGVASVHGIVCHVGTDADRARLVDFTLKTMGRIDILVNNAGINPAFGDILDVEEKTWDKIFDTNVKAGFLLTKLVVPHMDTQGKGNVVFVSSVAGYTPMMGLGAYSVSKTALLGLTKALSMSLAEKKIRVNCIAPGIIKTDFSKALLGEDGEGESRLASITPMGRVGTADDCSGIVSFLCSDDASYITGETVLITGGMNARL